MEIWQAAFLRYKSLEKPTGLNAVNMLKSSGMLLGACSDEFRAHKVIVQEAVKQNGLALGLASDDLRDCTKTVQIAVNNNPLAIELASSRVQKLIRVIVDCDLSSDN